MQRRRFLTEGLAAGGLAAAGLTGAAEGEAPERGFYELRAYPLRPGRQDRFDAYLQRALLPAAQRAELGPVGVFLEQEGEGKTTVWVLLCHRDASGAATFAGRLASDAEYLHAAAELLAGPTDNAVCERMESSLLGGIASMPRLEPPSRKPRLFNLRIYESFNTATLHKKIEMFNQGELAIFRRVGLTPVLFTETLVGTPLPSLTYLLVFDDDAARTAAWQRFRSDPEWQRMKAVPEYADSRLVSRITNKVLIPAEYSQI
jgi:hypothetical protein